MDFTKKIFSRYQVQADFAKWDTGVWLHHSNFPELKLNYNPSHLDILGIYLFPEKFHSIGNWKTFRFTYRVTLDPSIKILDFSKLDKEEALKILDFVVPGLSKEVKQEIHDSAEYVDKMWSQIQHMSFLQKKAATVNKRFRELGYDAIFDDTGAIHNAEVQLVILNPKKIKTIKRAERGGSGYELVKKATEILAKVGKNYGEVKTTKPKKKWSAWDRRYVLEAESQIFHPDYDHTLYSGTYASWKVTASSRISDSHQPSGREVKPTVVHLSLAYSSPKLNYGAGVEINIDKPDWERAEQQIKEIMDAIWKKAQESKE